MTTVQKISAVFLVIVGFFYFWGDPPDKTVAGTSQNWFSGGTLHEATIAEWQAASYQNRLATAADWTTGVIGQSEFERIGIDGVREKAESVVECISGSTKGLEGAESLSAMEIGAACITLMKW